MTVHVNGKKRKDFKVSLGKWGWETRNGAKVISTDKEDYKSTGVKAWGWIRRSSSTICPRGGIPA